MPSVLITQARISGFDEPVDVLAREGRLARVAPAVRSAGGSPEAVRADGRWLIPGLWDKHVHFGQWAASRRRIDLAGTASSREALQRVRSAIEAEAAGGEEVVVGFGYRMAEWSDEAAVEDLDRIAGARPVVLISGDAHNAWLSTSALDRAGLARRPGVVAEREWFESFAQVRDALGLGPTPAAYADAIRAAHALGVVGVVDLEFERGFALWPDRQASLPPLRVRTGVYPDDLEEAIGAGLRTGDPLGGLVRMGPLKVIVDGALGTRTAYCHEPYADGDHGRGVLSYGTEQLTELARRATGQGLALALHAIGDAALDVVLSAVERSGGRGSVEHAQLASETDLARMAACGLVASVQPAHLLDDREIAERCWKGRTARSFMLRAMLDAGVQIALGSDAPVAPLDPWLAIDAAVRRCVDGDEPWHPEQAIGRREALAASVDGRRIAPGEPADLVLLDDDPLSVTRPSVAATWVAGEQVYSA